MIKPRFFPGAKLSLLLMGLALQPVFSQTPESATLQGDDAHPARTHGWLDTKLYFGLGSADAPDQGVSEAQWRDFLDKEVTPRFPAGLSVVDVYGQWQRKQGQDEPQRSPSRIRTKMLILDYPASRENSSRIEAIRSAWKQRTGDRSVLKVTQRADVSF